MVMSCPDSIASQQDLKVPNRGQGTHTHLKGHREERRGQAELWTLVRSGSSWSETADDTQISDFTVFTLSSCFLARQLFQEYFSGAYFFIQQQREKIRLFIFNSSCRNILKGEKRSMCPPGKGFSIEVTVLALTKQVYDTQEREILFKKKEYKLAITTQLFLPFSIFIARYNIYIGKHIKQMYSLMSYY